MNEMPAYSQVRDMATGSEAQVTLRGNQFPFERKVSSI